MRHTISLACILKNEVSNIIPLLESVKDCFDEIHFTDTGSTDGSIELLEGLSRGTNPANAKIFLHHFKWVDDFSAARNYSFSHVKTDYVMWMDLDDVLNNAKDFISWRDSVMGIANFWIATYHYASDESGKPMCSFARERVIKNGIGLKWNYFIHEGISPKLDGGKVIEANYATTWQIVHKRNESDIKKDKSRNINIFEKNIHILDSRMTYYYGKELFDCNRLEEARRWLIDAVNRADLEIHDRIMGMQYLAMCLMRMEKFEEAIRYAHTGLMLEPNRAEFFICIADSYIKLNKITEGVPYYIAATKCKLNNGKIAGALFSHEGSYTQYPLNQLARIYANMGDLDSAEKYAVESAKFGAHPEVMGILTEIQGLKKKTGLTDIQVAPVKTEDIVISCHPQGLYEWDEEIYKTRGIGGSETAVVEMARHLHDITKRKVRVFNNRETALECNGVEYLSARALPLFLKQNEPKIHIAWRHNIKLTNAPTYLWNHDLAIPGIDNHHNYDAVLCLSDFHKKYVHNMCGVPLTKIIVTKNGVDPERFKNKKDKVPGSVIWSSSPDRGLDRALRVMDEVVKKIPHAVLNIYYGFDNMLKMGKKDQVDQLKQMILERPYAKYHGNISQTQLTDRMKESMVWLYPTNFLETYCITAVEALSSQAYPVTRAWGALPDTMRVAIDNKMASCIDSDCQTEDEINLYAGYVVSAIEGEHYKKIEINPEEYSWKRVAQEWVELFAL